MSKLLFTSISVGILSWFWGYISSVLGLITWIGFIGCTSYFACGDKSRNLSLVKSLICNFTGVFWAFLIIYLSGIIHINNIGAILTGIFSFVMCYQAKNKILGFIPGTFMGACSTFGSRGLYKAVIISLICGALVGYFSDLGGNLLFKVLGRKNSK